MNPSAPTETIPTTSVITPEMMAQVVAAILKISQALDRMDSTLSEIKDTLVLMQEQSAAQTTALEQIQMYAR